MVPEHHLPLTTYPQEGAVTERPRLRVVRGEPSEEELAALTAVVLAVSAGEGDNPPPSARPSAWADRSVLLRRAPHPGPGAWRASALSRR
jgi:hypothetical protein